ncbi:MAG: sigma-70 family RNA polymerase sigma factor [Actinobacteria bacterium]|nr:sigma-70 family RNA polymerase sigma factor [Rubrobacter sp.]MBA3630641.1 sigma-70 family RNA polymerase sigma factor [Actinomycetota bacterium]
MDPASETSVDLIAALQRLPARQRQATILYYIADLPIPVVAERMGLHEGSVKAHLAQARKRLRNLMEVRHV